LQLLMFYTKDRKNLDGLRDQRRSLLNLIAKHGFSRCLRYLVDDCACNPYTIGEKTGYSPLMEAAQRGHESVMEFLLAGKSCTADHVFATSPKQPRLSAVDIAACNGHDSALRCIQRFYPEWEGHRRAMEICEFRRAAIDGNVERVSRFIDQRDFPLDLPDSTFYTPLLHAVEQNRVDVVDLLLTQAHNRIDIKQRCQANHPLVRSRASKRKLKGATALILAVLTGSSDMVQTILNLPGIDTSVTIELHYNHMYKLLSEGQHRLDHRKYTAVTLAQLLGFQDIIELLSGRQSELPKNFSKARTNTIQNEHSKAASTMAQDFFEDDEDED
jgi:ankyrin repeat protein